MRDHHRALSMLPILAGTIFASNAVEGQIQPEGYRCGDQYDPRRVYKLTNNDSTAITTRTVACGAGFQSAYAHWFDLSAEPVIMGEYTVLKCVDFSFWSSSYGLNQPLFIRVYEDQTPGRQGVCTDQGFGDPSDPGPDVAGRVLLWEGTIVFEPSLSGVDSTVLPRPDGDRSVLVGPDIIGGPLGTPDGIPDGILLPPGIQFFIEIGDQGEAISRFGANTGGEAGDTEGPSSARVTWTRNPSCFGGGCTNPGGLDGGDYAKWMEFGPNFGDRDIVMVATLYRTELDLFISPLPFCPTDITGPAGQRDGLTEIYDLLVLLGNWGMSCPPRPTGDVAPELFGDCVVDVEDLLAVLGAWGTCPNPNTDCPAVGWQDNAFADVNEGLFPFDIDGTLDGPHRPRTNDINTLLNGPTACGWHDYGVDVIPGGFRWGDAFGIDLVSGVRGGDIWFEYTSTIDGTVVISTQSDCGPGEISDTILEVYSLSFSGLPCPFFWTQLIACNDSSAAACGDHARVELPTSIGSKHLIRIGGKLGEQGSGLLAIQPK
ncbi:MAG: hypothetical protein O7G85_10070 [Planctomycetota bacterium]|nr:hypothetical protein [Planctomycetota bacterium]